MMSAQEAAAALGGIATSPQSLLCPGPGHSPCDQNLRPLELAAPDGFLVHSFTGDDLISCRDHVRAALGLGLWRDRREQAASAKVRKPAPASEKPTEGPENGSPSRWRCASWPRLAILAVPSSRGTSRPRPRAPRRRCVSRPSLSPRAALRRRHSAGMVALCAISERMSREHPSTSLGSDSREAREDDARPGRDAAIKIADDDRVTRRACGRRGHREGPGGPGARHQTGMALGGRRRSPPCRCSPALRG